MSALFKSRLGTSEAAKRVDRAALASQSAQPSPAETAPVVTDDPLETPRETSAEWVARMRAEWEQRQPHVTVVKGALHKTILEEVCAAHKITLDELLSPARVWRLTRPRQEACYRLALDTSLSLPAIGRLLDRDHTTVLHGVRAHALRNCLPVPRQDAHSHTAQGGPDAQR